MSLLYTSHRPQSPIADKLFCLHTGGDEDEPDQQLAQKIKLIKASCLHQGVLFIASAYYAGMAKDKTLSIAIGGYAMFAPLVEWIYRELDAVGPIPCWRRKFASELLSWAQFELDSENKTECMRTPMQGSRA
jgi:hypothetical protein